MSADLQNGVITAYTIAYQSQTENHTDSVEVGRNDHQKNITGLKEYVNYNITVFASTVIGAGPHSSPVLVVRTDQDGKSFFLNSFCRCSSYFNICEVFLYPEVNTCLARSVFYSRNGLFNLHFGGKRILLIEPLHH